MAEAPKEAAAEPAMLQVGTREVYRNPWMSVREDTVRRADGGTGVYGVVDKPDFALIVPRGEGGVWLVQQFRYPVGRRAWEFPQGSWSAGSEGTREELARAELVEETGLRAGSMKEVGHLYGAYGFCSQGFDVFVATELIAGAPQREETESDMVVRWVSEQELGHMITEGEIIDAATVAAWALTVGGGWTAQAKVAR